MKLKVNRKSISGKKSKIKQMIFEYPICPLTVKELLEETVKLCVSDYNRRNEAGTELMQVFTKEDMESQALKGKISFGVNYGEAYAEEKSAIDCALQCFEDGLVAVFVDDVRHEGLMEPLNLKEDSEITFVRLTMLAGRMW